MKRTSLSITSIFIIMLLAGFYPGKYANLAQDVLIQTNQFRKAEGLAALTMRTRLNTIAQQHSEDMASGRSSFGHAGFDKRNAMAAKAIRPLHSFAENVAYGPTTGKSVVALWKSSPGHRRNMLGHFKYIGIGIARDRNGSIYYTEVFAD